MVMPIRGPTTGLEAALNGVGVACGCGRRMLVDPLRGRGAFKCGCGSRVVVSVEVPPRCAVVPEDGNLCAFKPARESVAVGLWLCTQHLKSHQDMVQALKDQVKQAEDNFHSELSYLGMKKINNRRQLAMEAARAQGRLVVYYIRIGDWIKIGATSNFESRMSSLQPDEVLATEPGYLDLERKRLEQFKHLRIRPRSERHRTAPELLDHIAMIRAHFGEPRAEFAPALVADAH